ncbi:MAG: hypothetical protein PWQ88_278 [Candidatus Methanomethylophilaceae archaeon]|nr:hypothetical protein [Candidatus Methanomethylophilaceae archaeon]MDI3542038.1 hypothetical protein [Candidatus Methanomethylophilaceae archaeon]
MSEHHDDGTNDTIESGYTKGVSTLLGDPRRAIRSLAIPMIVAMSLQTAYNLFDAIWVSGLGSDAMAAIGFVFPVFFIIVGLGSGIGIGGSSAIARRIGSKDKEGAQMVLMHSLLLAVIISIIISIPLLVFSYDLFVAMGAGSATEDAVAYGRVLFGGAAIMMVTNVLAGALRGEGDARRSSIILALGSVLNVVLDPIFIYSLDMGIAGAAWATLVSFGITAIVLLYLYIAQKETYLKLDFRLYYWNSAVNRDILRVGLPASLMHISMALTQFVIIILITMAAGTTDGVAIYTTGWRVISMTVVVLQGIASAVTPVTGAAYGARQYDKLSTSHLYAVKSGFITGLVLLGIIFVIAPQIVHLFTWSPDSAHLFDELVLFIRIMVFMVPFTAFGMLSSAAFQGMGMGIRALITTLFNAVFLSIPFCYIMGIVFNMGLIGIWLGLCSASIISSIIVFGWVRLTIRGLLRAEKEMKSDLIKGKDPDSVR